MRAPQNRQRSAGVIARLCTLTVFHAVGARPARVEQARDSGDGDLLTGRVEYVGRVVLRCRDVKRLPESVQVDYGDRDAAMRSEEHTSELQSRGQLVCRLLLEKKNKDIILMQDS